ncbi:MAG: hypothetical protein JO273_20070 [Methylobacteriaceae bacterium]|nr:hypothetical protein [Methylobacteriaceae bacterium]
MNRIVLSLAGAAVIGGAALPGTVTPASAIILVSRGQGSLASFPAGPIFVPGPIIGPHSAGAPHGGGHGLGYGSSNRWQGWRYLEFYHD